MQPIHDNKKKSNLSSSPSPSANEPSLVARRCKSPNSYIGDNANYVDNVKNLCRCRQVRTGPKSSLALGDNETNF